MTTQFAELKITLLPGMEDNYHVDLQFRIPGSDAWISLLGSQPIAIRLDPSELTELLYSPEDYGRRLSEQFFSPRVREAFVRAREAALSRDFPIRLRLRIASEISVLQELAWEMLVDPEDETPLSVKEDIFFCRELSLLDSRPVYQPPRGALRAMIMAANPSNLDQLGLPPIDVHAEVKRAAKALKGFSVNVVSEPGGPPATLDRMLDALREAGEDGFDTLYLIAHGGYVRGQYFLIFEDENRLYAMEEGKVIVRLLKGLRRPPRLLVLMACQGAKVRPASADKAFAARLAEAGIPAVVAVQGDFSMNSAAVLMPTFFRELAQDGQIDRAMAVARIAIRDRHDFWMPALFTCLESGMIWKDDPPSSHSKYNVVVQGGKGTVVGDHNTINQNFQALK